MKIFGHYVYSPIAGLAAAEFAVAAGSLAFASIFFGGHNPREGGVLASSIAFGLAILGGLTAMGLYQTKQRLRIEGVLARIVVGVGLAAVLLAVVNFFLQLEIERRLWVSTFVLATILLGVVRFVFWRWVEEHEMFQRRVLVYGAGKLAASLLKLRRRSDRRGFSIVAFVRADGDERSFEDPRVVRIHTSVLDYALGAGVDEIVVAMDDRRGGFPIADLLACRFAGIAVVELLQFLERETGKVSVDVLNPSWLIFSEAPRIPTLKRVLTRIIDLAIAVPMLVIALPVMACIAAAILLVDGAPVLYRQTRVGYMGRAFTLYKFRSMVKDAETSGDALWAAKRDARVTRVGAWLRKLRCDELPQLFNVITGTMSLVGPRPERPQFVERLSKEIPYYHERHVVKPGITGWAQLSYPYGASDQDALEKLQYDLYYIKNKSLIFDLMVLLQTAEVVLWGKGAR
jgi:sugar transferase (PEP-CTERM system associated)